LTQLTLFSFPVLESPPPYSRMDENIVALEAIRVADPQEPRLSGYITPNHQDGSVSISRVGPPNPESPSNWCPYDSQASLGPRSCDSQVSFGPRPCDSQVSLGGHS
jgi:hypothetical protein